MKLACDIVRDLLPLYAEDMASPASREAVAAHLRGCPACSAALAAALLPAGAVPPAAAPLGRLRSRMARRRQAAALCAAAVLLVCVMLFSYLITPHYLPYSQSLVTCKQVGSALAVTVNTPHSGYSLDTVSDPGSPGGVFHVLSVWASPAEKRAETRTLLLLPADISLPVGTLLADPASTVIIPVEAVGSLYYTDYAAADRLLWPAQNDGFGIATLPRLVLNYYRLAALASAAVSGAIWLLAKGKKPARIARPLCLASISYLLGHLCIKGFSATTAALLHDLFFILAAAVPVFVILHLALQLRRGSRAG